MPEKNPVEEELKKFNKDNSKKVLAEPDPERRLSRQAEFKSGMTQFLHDSRDQR